MAIIQWAFFISYARKLFLYIYTFGIWQIPSLKWCTEVLLGVYINKYIDTGSVGYGLRIDKLYFRFLSAS